MDRNKIIDSLSHKVDQLIAGNEKLRKDYGQLSAQRDRIKRENKELKNTVASLEKRIAVLELEKGLSGGSGVDTKVACARINRLLREIDRCIALVNK